MTERGTGQPDALTLVEASRECGLAANTLRIQINKGRLRATKIGWDWMVARADLAQYLEMRAPAGRRSASERPVARPRPAKVPAFSEALLRAKKAHNAQANREGRPMLSEHDLEEAVWAVYELFKVDRSATSGDTNEEPSAEDVESARQAWRDSAPPQMRNLLDARLPNPGKDRT